LRRNWLAIKTIVPENHTSLPVYEALVPWLGITADKDVPVIVSTINGTADFLVTGDTGDFGVLMQRDDLPFRLLTPADFVALAGELLRQ